MASFSEFGNNLYTGKKSIDFVGRRRIWYTISLVLVAISILVPLVRGGYTFGIEFTGGSEFVVSNVPTDLDQTKATHAVQDITPEGTPKVSIVGDNGIRVQTQQLTTDQNTEIRQALATVYNVPLTDVTASFIGASWGADITQQALRALVIFILLAAAVMAIYFRTWKMSLVAIIALVHDLIITAGFYALTGFEVTPAAVIGFLTILGYSLYDTVVVFDKIRENNTEDFKKFTRTFAESVNLAENQTLVRSINTSIVAILPVASILFIGAFLLGAGTLRDISLALLVGIIVGTYSTIFIAAPLYTEFRVKEPNIRKHDKKVLTDRQRATEKSDTAVTVNS